MEIKSLTDSLSVSPQIMPSDIQAIKDAGFRAIICNRPDGEGADQPTYDEIAAAAQNAELKSVYLPIVSGNLRDSDAQEFGATLADLPSPVLAYCRSGTRSATLWSLSEAHRRPLADILAATRAAGYDMSSMISRIENGSADANR